MRLPRLAILLLLAAARAPDPGPSSSTASLDNSVYGGNSDDECWGDDMTDAEEDDEDDVDVVDPEWEGAAVPTAAQLLGLVSLDDLYASGGAPVQFPIDLDKLVELCYNGWSNAEIAEELGCTDRVVRYRKAQLGLTWLQQTPWLPACDLLEEWWRLNPGITTSALAIVLGLSSTTLRRHMRRVGFRPSAGRLASNKELLRAVKIIKARKVMFSLGRTFMEGALRNEFRMCATDRQIRDALRTVDPVGSRKRAKQAGKARRSYSVAGPRSLYHADAHEKIARLGPRRAFVSPMFLVARPPP